MKVGVRMPYIDSTPALSPYKVREGNLQQGFVDLLVKHGWKKVVEFKKAVTSTHFVTEHTQTTPHEDRFVVANHIIVRNARGDMLGIASIADWKALTDHAKGFPYYNFATSTKVEKEALITYLEGEYDKQKTNTTLYFYMIEKLPVIQNDSTILAHWGLETEGDKRLQMALDVEVTEVGFNSTTVGSEHVKVADINVMQSPIVESALRAPFLENINYPYMSTNWWADSEINIKGYVDSNSVFLVLQTDNTPMWEDNVLPTIPLYFGDIVPEDEGDPAVALFAGTVPTGTNADAVAKYDFDSVVEGGKSIFPILKKYPSNPSNGVDSVMISRTKLGARYQSYYLSWNTAPQTMPPSRDNGDELNTRDYPRAWDNRGYGFNPSRYSGRVQTSHVYLVHPEEGNRGHLKMAIGMNAAGLNASELRIRKEDCPDRIFDVFQCMPISALSPLTKRPSTHYRPMGIGIYKEELNQTTPFTKDPSDVLPPSEVTGLKAIQTGVGIVKLTWRSPTEGDFSHIKIFVNDSLYAVGVTEVESYVLNNLAASTELAPTSIKLITVDFNGNESLGATVEVAVD